MTIYYTPTAAGSDAEVVTPQGVIQASLHRPTENLPWLLLYHECFGAFKYLTGHTVGAPSLEYIKDLLSKHEETV